MPLYQIGDGPISFDRAALERDRFPASCATSITRKWCAGRADQGQLQQRGALALHGRAARADELPRLPAGAAPALRGALLAPHVVPEFLHHEIEIVTDEQTIDEWKEQARSTTTYKTKTGREPVEFKTQPKWKRISARPTCREIVKAGLSLECSGPASRNMPERPLAFMLRDAWEREKGFPGQLVNHLRPYLVEAGLHFFKHRKRVLYISATQAGAPQARAR